MTTNVYSTCNLKHFWNHESVNLPSKVNFWWNRWTKPDNGKANTMVIHSICSHTRFSPNWLQDTVFFFQNYNPDLDGLRSQDLLLWILLVLILCGLLDHDKEVNIISSFMSEHSSVLLGSGGVSIDVWGQSL